MLHELDVLETRRIADLANGAHVVRDRPLEKVRAPDTGEPEPARGARNPASSLELNSVLERGAEFKALCQEIAALPRDLREKLWLVSRIGSGQSATTDWEHEADTAALLTNAEIATDLAGDAELHHHLRKGLYELGDATLPGDAV